MTAMGKQDLNDIAFVCVCVCVSCQMWATCQQCNCVPLTWCVVYHFVPSRRHVSDCNVGQKELRALNQSRAVIQETVV